MPEEQGATRGETPPAAPSQTMPPAGETLAGETPAATAPLTTTTTQTAASPLAEGQAPQADAEDEGEEFDKERALRTIRTLRAEAKKATAAIKELDHLRKERQEAEDARLSEIDRATKRAAHLEAELKLEREDRQARVNRYEVQLHAARLGIVDPEAAVKLLDWSSLEYADDGQPKDVDRALTLLLKDRPYLAGQAPAGPGTSPGNPATRTQAPGQRLYSRADLADYTFYRKNQADIQAAYREGRIVD